MLRQPDERDEHLVRRLESFSDVVIGFSLAELTLSLNVPVDPGAALREPWWLFAYLWTFAVVSYLWFEHHRLFARAFSPRRLSLLLNFAWLATIGVIVYMVQLIGRVIEGNGTAGTIQSIFEWYFGFYGGNLLILAALYALGIQAHRASLDTQKRAQFEDAFWRFSIAGFVVLVLVAAGPFMAHDVFFPLLSGSIMYGFIIAGIAVRCRKRLRI